ncbi:Zinc finger protein CONSTANS-LIKE 4 [Platanthera guangdongensis]|uniref:Zinc finger protein CONSTANS-LIKE 4 n=1 Tax=Platanthera guangdongensis TaxID=2320717 RepID=A0ABR2LLQ8_9ASPA
MNPLHPISLHSYYFVVGDTSTCCHQKFTRPFHPHRSSLAEIRYFAGDDLSSSMASTSGTKIPESSGQPPAPAPASAAASAAARECESCRSVPGIPFCRVEWSFLCIGCASVVHGHNCVVSVPPNANPNPNFPHLPYYPYAYPHPFANPSSDPNAAVHLSSEDDDLSPSHPDGQGKGWSQIPAKAASCRRLESVMRYREKRKSRKFEKTVRYENRRAYAELRPRMDGKFARRKDGAGMKEAAPPPDAVVGGHQGVRAAENLVEEGASPGYMGMDQVSARPDAAAELGGMVAVGVELGQHDFIEDVRFQ